MAAVDAVAPDLGATQACRALGISRATLYRRRRPPTPPASSPPRPRPPRALSDAERQTVRAVLQAPRFVDLAPAEVVATLLDEGTYLASERTMYRILAQAGQTGERRNQIELAIPMQMEKLRKEEPPALMKGNGSPVTGMMPMVIPMFTRT